MVEQVLRGLDAFGGKHYREARPHAAHVHHLGIEAGHKMDAKWRVSDGTNMQQQCLVPHPFNFFLSKGRESTNSSKIIDATLRGAVTCLTRYPRLASASADFSLGYFRVFPPGRLSEGIEPSVSAANLAAVPVYGYMR